MKNPAIIVLVLLIAVLSLLLFMHVEDVPGDGYLASSEEVASDDALEMTFLDIGQGDATFITFPNGEQMLVDCAIDARIIEALGRVMPYYDRSIDYLLLTHPDLDHYGGCQEVLARFDVGKIVSTGIGKGESTRWQAYDVATLDEGAEFVIVEKEDVWEVGSSTIHFLYPDHNLVVDAKIPGEEKQPNANDGSVVMRLSYGDTSVLLTGDAEKDLEEYLIETYGDQLDVDILKAGHHGSDSSSIVDFLDIVTPDHTIISAGKNNRYNHPSRRVLKRLERASSTVWRTDVHGDVVVTVSDEGYVVESF